MTNPAKIDQSQVAGLWYLNQFSFKLSYRDSRRKLAQKESFSLLINVMQIERVLEVILEEMPLMNLTFHLIMEIAIIQKHEIRWVQKVMTKKNNGKPCVWM